MTLSPQALGEQVRALVEGDLDDARLVEIIRGLEEVTSACAATQARLTERLDVSVRGRHAAQGVPADQQGRGVAAEVAVARKVSPARGARHLGLAIVLVREMPYTMAALEHGHLSEWRATLLARETACLSRADRANVDESLCADPSRLEGWGDRRLVGEVRRIAYRLDPASVTARARWAETQRRVSLRPAPDTMSWFGALLPVAQGVAVYATLGRLADQAVARGDSRTRGQLMADLLVERVTGEAADTPVRVTVDLTISDQALLAGGYEPAWVGGYGVVPAAWARELTARAATAGRAALRRLYARPHDGTLVAAESSARTFPRGLATLIDLRDQTCRTPWCDAPIRHHDHVVPWELGGSTAQANAQGLCVQCNHAKQAGGWRTESTTGPPGAAHVVETTTPAGQQVTSRAPGLPPPCPPHYTLKLDFVWPPAA